MVRLFLDVGRSSKVGPSDIVGAVANEAGVPGRAIGAIDVHDRFSLVEVPSEYIEQVLRRMSGSRIRGHNANIRVAAPRDASRGESPPAKAARGKQGRKGNGSGASSTHG
jgi:ATP-dependent RNA helicase DeaD